MLCAFLYNAGADAQILDKVRKAARRGVERTAENRAEAEARKATNEAIDVFTDNKKKNGSEDSPRSDVRNPGVKPEPSQNSPILVEHSGNEVPFVRGKKILYNDDFARDAIGDFPAKWNTTGSGEIRQLSGLPGKWLRVPAGSVVNLETTKAFPENFTIEFDLIIPGDIEYRLVGIGLGEKPERLDYTLMRSKSYGFMFYSQQNRNYDGLRFGNYQRGSDAQWKKREYKIPMNQVIKFAIEVNNYQRIRAYVNGIKIVDEPRAFKPDFARSFFLHAMTHGAAASKQNYFYVSNLVIAESGTDARSTVIKDLLEKGSFTTSDIHFASGSDRIEQRSEAILKEIGEAMRSATGSTFLITGHTDSDGAEAANQVLSEKRAAAVKNHIVKNFGIPQSTLITNGKGEIEPVADNGTPEGKAQNRRVEFRKL